MTPLRAIRYATWAAVALAAAAVLLLVVRPFGFDPLGRGGGAPGFIASSIGGPFTLTAQTGATVTEASLKGHPSAMFFGYTYCPDVCPTTLADMTVWLEELGADADKLHVYFVTVDPERDTAGQMAEYLTAFDPRISGLTGTRPEVDRMLEAYRVYSRKVEGGDPAYYTMDHTASVYLLDAEGRFVGTVDYQENPATALAKLKRLVGA
jgi:protein SCO1/2